MRTALLVAVALSAPAWAGDDAAGLLKKVESLIRDGKELVRKDRGPDAAKAFLKAADAAKDAADKKVLAARGDAHLWAFLAGAPQQENLDRMRLSYNAAGLFDNGPAEATRRMQAIEGEYKRLRREALGAP